MTTPQGNTLKNRFERNCESVTLSYLMYDGTESDKLSFPMRLRERYLTPGSCPATLQGIGTELQIGIRTDRNNVIVRLPFDSWHATRQYDGTISDLGGQAAVLSVGRFQKQLRPQVYEEDGSRWIDGLVWVQERWEM